MHRKYIDYDLNLEQSVLGVCINLPTAFGSVYNLLNEDCFYPEDHKQLYRIIKKKFDQGYPIDLMIINRAYGDEGITEVGHKNVLSYLIEMSGGFYSDAHAEFWAADLRKLAAQRMMIEIQSSKYDYTIDPYEQSQILIDRISRVTDIRATDDWVHISKVNQKLQLQMDDKVNNKNQGCTSSITELDALNGRLQGGMFIVIGARPSVGKSAFMGRIAVHNSAQGKTVGVISLEMEDTKILGRMAAAESTIPFKTIDNNEMEQAQRNYVYDKLGELAKLPIYFSDKAQVNWSDIRVKATKLKKKHGLDMLIIDYLQLVEPESNKNSNREQEVSKISRNAKLLAMTLGIPVIMLAQLNRATGDNADKKPSMKNLRESGSIEQDADVVILLHRDFIAGIKTDADGRSTEHEADLIVDKWRNGSTINIKMGFDGKTMKFLEYEGDRKNFALPQGLKPPQFDNPHAGIYRQLPPEKEEDAPF